MFGGCKDLTEPLRFEWAGTCDSKQPLCLVVPLTVIASIFLCRVTVIRRQHRSTFYKPWINKSWIYIYKNRVHSIVHTDFHFNVLKNVSSAFMSSVVMCARTERLSPSSPCKELLAPSRRTPYNFTFSTLTRGGLGFLYAKLISQKMSWNEISFCTEVTGTHFWNIKYLDSKDEPSTCLRSQFPS